MGDSKRSQKINILNWYTMDEIKTFRKDATMISRAFILQKIRRRKQKLKAPLLQSKTVCIIGLENRINFKRRLQRESSVRLVLEAQARFKNIFSFTSLQSHLAVVSSSATSNARRQALEDGKLSLESVKQNNEKLYRRTACSNANCNVAAVALKRSNDDIKLHENVPYYRKPNGNTKKKD